MKTGGVKRAPLSGRGLLISCRSALCLILSFQCMKHQGRRQNPETRQRADFRGCRPSGGPGSGFGAMSPRVLASSAALAFLKTPRRRSHGGRSAGDRERCALGHPLGLVPWRQHMWKGESDGMNGKARGSREVWRWVPGGHRASSIIRQGQRENWVKTESVHTEPCLGSKGDLGP